MRRIALFGLLCTLVLPLQAEKRKVSFLAAEYSTATSPYWAEVEKEFEAANPDIDVEIDVSSWEGLHDKITTLIGAKRHPDLVNIGTPWLVEYVKEGIAQPIDDLLKPEFKGRFIENLLQGAVVDGKTFGLPIATSVRALYYNKDMFEKAGVQPPKTWEELKEVAKKVAKPPRTYGYLMPIHPADQGDTYDYFLWAAGGDWFDAQGNCTLNSPAAVEALECMLDLYKSNCTNKDPWASKRDDTQKLFTAGRAAMMPTGNFFVPIIAKDNPSLKYGVTAIPAHKKPGTLAVTDTLALFKREGQDKEAVWKFVEFMYDKKWRDQFTKKEGMLPELKDLAKELESDPKLGMFVKLLPEGKFLPNHEHFMPVSQRLVKAIQLALMGEAKPKEALDAAVEEINKTILKK